MDPVRPLLIANPHAGPWWRKKAGRSFLSSYLCRFPDGRVLESSPEIDDRNFLEKALDGTDLLVVYGGDGTVHRIIQSPLPPTLPILVAPGGTGNVLARYLRIPSSPGVLFNRLSEAVLLGIRPGTAGNRLFLIMAGAGWDGLAARNVPGKGLLGPLSYYGAGILALLSPGLPVFRVRIDTPEHTPRVFEDVRWCLASRLPPYFGPFAVRTQEGAGQESLTVTLVRGNRLGIPRAFLSFLPGGSFVRPSFQCRTTGITLSPLSSPDVPLQADGEILPFSPRIGISERILSLVSFRNTENPGYSKDS